VKGTYVNKAIRHYLGQKYFVEYTGENPDLLEYDDEIPECDYKEFDAKRFFIEHVSKYRPCLFKRYAEIWPAYHKWQNETYLKEVAGDEVIYPER
jgi:hypothetical protein